MPIPKRANSRVRSQQESAREAVWREHVEAWKVSGLTELEYCEENGLFKRTFEYWITYCADQDVKESQARRKAVAATLEARRRMAKGKVGAVDFVPVEIFEGDSAQPNKSGASFQAKELLVIEIVTPKAFVLRVPVDSVDVASVQMVLTAIESMTC